jgi:hypothetical protein
MHILFKGRIDHDGILRINRALAGAAAIIACFVFFSCAKISEIGRGPASQQASQPSIMTTPGNFDVALKENQTALATRKIAPDIALYNTGFLLAHPSNPKKDYPKAVLSFQTLVAEHPGSSLLEPAKTWIQVLEQQQKVAEQQQKVGEDRRKLAEEKRALDREREMLSQERQKLNYASEKSRQLDLEIEKRRRQSLSK